MSLITVTSRPEACRLRMADSRPAPGPFTNTSTFRNPHSKAFTAHSCPATWAAEGVFFFEPLKPILPAEYQATTCPDELVSEMMMLLNVAWMWAWPGASTTPTRFLVLSFFFSAGVAIVCQLSFSCLFLIGYGLPFAFARARVILSGLSSPGQPPTVAESAIATDVHQAFDAQLHFRFEQALHLIGFCNGGANGIRFFIVPFFHLLVEGHAGFRQNLLRGSFSYAKNIGETDFASFIVGNIYSCYACHNYPCLCLCLGFFLLIT